jgi:hypothetical protein
MRRASSVAPASMASVKMVLVAVASKNTVCSSLSKNNVDGVTFARRAWILAFLAIFFSFSRIALCLVSGIAPHVIHVHLLTLRAGGDRLP